MLVNLNEDSMLNGKLKYGLNKQINRVGSRNESSNDIQIGGVQIKEKHGFIEINEDGNAYISAEEGKIWLNGKEVINRESIKDRDRIVFGKSTAFIFKDQNCEINIHMDWE